jgi:glycosyltransferase involved in cell wall biosynthesis
VYREADVFALASDHESFGMVLLEAMSSGLPVVAPAVDWIPNIVDDRTDGYLYDPEERSELVECLEHLYGSEHERRRLGENARESIVQGYDWDSRGRKLKRLFEAVLGRCTRHARM